MTTWLPCLLAVALVVVEGVRQVVRHVRRERWLAMLARATVLTVPGDGIFRFYVGHVVSWAPKVKGVPLELQILCGCPHETGTVVKIDYGNGRLWVASP